MSVLDFSRRFTWPLVLLTFTCALVSIEVEGATLMAEKRRLPPPVIVEDDHTSDNAISGLNMATDFMAFGLNVFFLVTFSSVALLAAGPVMGLMRYLMPARFKRRQQLPSFPDLMLQESNSVVQRAMPELNENIFVKAWNEIDLVDSTFSAMKVNTDGCKQRLACEIEKSLTDSTVLSFALSWLSNRLQTHKDYRIPTQLGRLHGDCVKWFPRCSYTLGDKLGWNKNKNTEQPTVTEKPIKST